MSSGEASGIVQCNLRIFDSGKLLSIKNGRGFPQALCGVTCFWFDLVLRQLLLQERNVTQGNWFRRVSNEKLVIFENDPLSKHWRIAWTYLSITVTLFNEIATEYGINLFSFLNSDFHNCPEKWLMGFFCSWVYISLWKTEILSSPPKKCLIQSPMNLTWFILLALNQRDTCRW